MPLKHLFHVARLQSFVSNPVDDVLKMAPTMLAAVPVQPVIVFIHPATELALEAGPVPVYTAEKLKKHIAIDAPRLTPEAYQVVAKFLEKATMG